MRRKLPAVLILLLFVTGLCVFLYPMVSDWAGSRSQTKVVEVYDNAMKEVVSEELEAMRTAAEAYNRGLRGNVILTDPFDASLAVEASGEYEALLNIRGDGVMGYVRIPKIDVLLPLYHGTSPQVLEKGAGHLENTSLPIGGTGTHAVISAHTGLPTATMFTDLVQVVEGDLFFLEVLGETLAYRVDQILVVDPEDTGELLIHREADYVTLLTCTPYGINSHRLLVRGVRTQYEEVLEEEAVQEKAKTTGRNWPYITAGLLFVLILTIYAVYGIRLKKRNRERM